MKSNKLNWLSDIAWTYKNSGKETGGKKMNEYIINGKKREEKRYEMKWDEMKWDEIRWDEMRLNNRHFPIQN